MVQGVIDQYITPLIIVTVGIKLVC